MPEMANARFMATKIWGSDETAAAAVESDDSRLLTLHGVFFKLPLSEWIMLLLVAFMVVVAVE